MTAIKLTNENDKKDFLVSKLFERKTNFFVNKNATIIPIK